MPVPLAAWIAEKATMSVAVTLTRVSVAESLSVFPTPVPSCPLPLLAALTMAGPARAVATTPPSAPTPAVMILRRDVGACSLMAIVASPIGVIPRLAGGPIGGWARVLDGAIVSGVVESGVI